MPYICIEIKLSNNVLFSYWCKGSNFVRCTKIGSYIVTLLSIPLLPNLILSYLGHNVDDIDDKYNCDGLKILDCKIFDIFGSLILREIKI
jgi:hypothetical protein